MQKIKVFGLGSDLEHFHSPLQNIALCSSVSVLCVRAEIRIAGSPVCEENAPSLNANTECGCQKRQFGDSLIKHDRGGLFQTLQSDS